MKGVNPLKRQLKTQFAVGDKFKLLRIIGK